MPWRTLDMHPLRWHSYLKNKSNIFLSVHKGLNHKMTGKHIVSHVSRSFISGHTSINQNNVRLLSLEIMQKA